MRLGSYMDRLSAYKILWLWLLIPAATCLPWLALQANYWHAQQQMVRAQAGVLEQTRQLEQSADAGLAKWQDTLANWEQLASRARTQGRAIDLWQAHSVRVNDKQFSRQEADAFLGSLFTNDQALFVPETFSIRLSGRQNSLLVAKPADDEDKAVFITLIGTYYSRRQP